MPIVNSTLDREKIPTRSSYMISEDFLDLYHKTFPHPDLVNIYNSSIGRGTKVAAFVEIGGAVVGERCKIEAFAYLCPGVTLENGVFIGPHVTFTNDDDPRKSMTDEDFVPIPTLVREGAVIGAGAVILPGVTIGAYAIVGAGAVVTADVATFTTVLGNPARLHL